MQVRQINEYEYPSFTLFVEGFLGKSEVRDESNDGFPQSKFRPVLPTIYTLSGTTLY